MLALGRNEGVEAELTLSCPSEQMTPRTIILASFGERPNMDAIFVDKQENP
jgi:hypothetical protein